MHDWDRPAPNDARVVDEDVDAVGRQQGAGAIGPLDQQQGVVGKRNQAKLIELTRADCTTRNQARAFRLRSAYDDLAVRRAARGRC